MSQSSLPTSSGECPPTHAPPSPRGIFPDTLMTLAPLWAVIIWSGNTIVTKAATGVISPASITFYRWLLAFTLLTPFLGRAAWRQRQVVFRHWQKLATLGLLGMAAFQGLAYQAAQTTSAINMGVILALIPLSSALVAHLFSTERISAREIMGAVVSLLGVAILLTDGEPRALWQHGIAVGDVLMLAAVFSNALYSVLLRRWNLPLTRWQQLYVQIGFGVLVVLPFWLASPISAITVENAPLILYAAIPASLGAPYFWIHGVKHWGAARASLFMNLLPIIVTLLAWVLLSETIQKYQLVGGLITLLGVALGVTPNLWRLSSRLRQSQE
jgi:drug/metabolite transporter (DMT)-like permease